MEMGAEDMQVGSVSEGDLSSVNNGLTPQPEGESVSGHAASSEEESPETLANKAREAPRSTAEEGSPPGNEPPLSPTKTTKITRATARLTLDLRRRLDDPDRVWADELDKALIKAQRECSRAANAVTRILGARTERRSTLFARRTTSAPRIGPSRRSTRTRSLVSSRPSSIPGLRAPSRVWRW